MFGRNLLHTYSADESPTRWMKVDLQAHLLGFVISIHLSKNRMFHLLQKDLFRVGKTMLSSPTLYFWLYIRHFCQILPKQLKKEGTAKTAGPKISPVVHCHCPLAYPRYGAHPLDVIKYHCSVFPQCYVHQISAYGANRAIEGQLCSAPH